MTENKPPEKPAAEKPAAKPKVGEVVQTAPGQYALVVGFETVNHQHQDSNGAQTDSVKREHPLVIDLPGKARRHEIETLPL
jgi:hypothetical protein